MGTALLYCYLLHAGCLPGFPSTVKMKAFDFERTRRHHIPENLKSCRANLRFATMLLAWKLLLEPTTNLSQDTGPTRDPGTSLVRSIAALLAITP